MKKSQLRKIIREEIMSILREDSAEKRARRAQSRMRELEMIPPSERDKNAWVKAHKEYEKAVKEMADESAAREFERKHPGYKVIKK